MRVASTGIGHFAVAENGTLVYRTRDTGVSGWTAPRTLVWVERDGREQPLAAPARPYVYPRMSPDGTRIALDVRDQENDIWVWDLGRETLSRLSFDAGTDDYPVWMPDGQQVLYSAPTEGRRDAFRRAADGTGEVEQLTTHERPIRPYAVTPDGTRLILREDVAVGQLDLVVMVLDGDRELEPLLTSEFNERNAEISPDGLWMAYESDESGQFEIYVRPFPDVNTGRWQVSTGGGTEALWSPVGGELFYRTPDGRVMSVPVTTEDSFAAGNPSVAVAASYFDGPEPFWGRMYDVSPDGQRFLMIKEGDGQLLSSAEFVVVLNWLEELKERVPVP